jgi:hypothetical protein
LTRRQRSLMRGARRERDRQKLAPCRCRSSRLAGVCCLSGDYWHKPPATLNLRVNAAGQALDRCHMRELGNCEPPISGEHLISEGVIEVLRAGGDFTVSGLPWLEVGKTKKLAPKNLVAKCLCKGHNSALSPLDDCAILFFFVLRQCLEDTSAPSALLISGHDLERWL